MQALFIEHPRIEILVSVKDGVIVDTLAYEQDPGTKKFRAVAFPNLAVADLVEDYQRKMDAEKVLERMAGKGSAEPKQSLFDFEKLENLC